MSPAERAAMAKALGEHLALLGEAALQYAHGTLALESLGVLAEAYVDGLQIYREAERLANCAATRELINEALDGLREMKETT